MPDTCIDISILMGYLIKKRKNLVSIQIDIIYWFVRGKNFLGIGIYIYITATTFPCFFSNPIAFNYHFVLKILIRNSCPDYCLFNLYQSYNLFQSIITQVVDISILNLFSCHSIFLIVSITVERWQVSKKFLFF